MDCVTNCVRRLALGLVLLALCLPASTTVAADARDAEVRVGVPQNRPMVFMDADDRPCGISVGVLDEIARREGWELVYVPCSWEECLNRLSSGELDLLIDIAYSEARSHQYDFSDECILLNWGRLYARPGAGIRSVLDVRGRRVAVMKGDIYYQEFRTLMDAFDLTCDVLETDSYADALTALTSGEADAVIVSRLFSAQYKSLPKAEETGMLFTPVELRFATTKGRNQALIEAADRGITELKADKNSAYYQGLEHWLGQMVPAAVPRCLIWAGFGVVVFACLVVLVNRRLKRMVRSETAALRKARALLDQTERLGKVGGWESDAATGHMVWTDEVYRIYGVDPGEYDSRSGGRGSGFYSPEDEARLEDAFQRCLEAGEPYDLEARMTNARGERLWVRTMGQAEMRDGVVSAVYGNIMDVTEHKRSEEDLRKSEEMYRALVAGLPDVVMRFDCQGRHLFVSENVNTVVDLEATEFLGKTHRELGFPESQCRFWEQGIRSVFKTGEPYETEFTFESPDGQAFHEWRVVPERDAEGSVRSVLSVSRDITAVKLAEEEREKLREQFHQAQKLESVGQLAGGVAHDFNNLLTGIAGFSRFALDEMPQDSSARADLEEVLKLSDRAATLTRQLLAFSRRQPLERQVLNINQTIDDMTKMLGRLIGEHIEWVFVPTERLWHIDADPGQVEQVLVNLVVNARDAMPGGGTLTVETGNVVLDNDYAKIYQDMDAGDYVMLAVSDTGCGMDAETREHLFEPFFTTKGPDRGTGLGLATVYGIVRQHGGGIWVYSEPGEGATFKVYLPRAKSSASETHYAPAVPARTRGTETILVVEDEPAVRRVAARYLESHGYCVLAASTPQEADHVLAEHGREVSLVLTDVVLPERSGPDFFEAAVKEHPHLSVLYMSGYTDNAIIHHCVLGAGVSFIQKPFTPEGLAGKIREVLGTPGD